jgi:hypothetical protein
VVDGVSSLVLGKKLFDFPVILLGADAELEVLFGD